MKKLMFLSFCMSVLFALQNANAQQPCLQWDGTCTTTGNIFRSGTVQIGPGTVDGTSEFRLRVYGDFNPVSIGDPEVGGLYTRGTNALTVEGQSYFYGSIAIQNNHILGLKSGTTDYSFMPSSDKLQIVPIALEGEISPFNFHTDGMLELNSIGVGFYGKQMIISNSGGLLSFTPPLTPQNAMTFNPNGTLRVKKLEAEEINYDVFTTDLYVTDKLDVNERLYAKKLIVRLPPFPPDYVFDAEYELMSLNDLSAYIEKNKHLPNIPSAKEMEEEGTLEVGQFQFKNLEKIEELTLYILQLNDRLNKIEKENKHLKEKLDALSQN